MSSKEQYKEYNKKLNREIKDLKKTVEQLRSQNWDLRARLASNVNEIIRYKFPLNLKVIWFIWGVSMGMALMLLLNLIKG